MIFKEQFPPELGSLSRLEHIDLSGGPSRFLSGLLPTAMGALTKLKSFEVGWNELEGHIPPEYGQWSSLELFDVCLNNLSGRLPGELGKWLP